MKKQKPQIREQRIKLRVEKAGKIMVALLQWPAVSEKLGYDPLGLDEAPQWVWNAIGELVKVVLPSRRVPKDGEWDDEFIGELFGRLIALARLHLGEIAMGPMVEAECAKWQQAVDSRPDSREKRVLQKLLSLDFEGWLKGANEAVGELTAGALSSSHEDAVKFQEGLLRGMKLRADELTTARTFQRHTRTFLVLVLYWRYWASCRSVREIYKHLCKAVGEKKIGSFKTFENHVVKKVGLKVRGRGRPRAAK